MLYVLIFSCHLSPEEISYDRQKPKQTREEPEIVIIEPTSETSDIGWTQLGVQECVHPTSEVTYSDQSHIFGFEDEVFGNFSIEGGMALMQYQDAWWIWQIVAPGLVEGRSENGESQIIETPNIPIRLYIDDIDQNGLDDMMIVGEFFVIVWDVLNDTQQTEVIIPFTSQQSIRDVGTFDADGDGDLDIWIFAADGEIGHDASWGWLLKNQGNREFLEPQNIAPEAPWAVSWDGFVMDWDEDGDPDIYVCNDFGPMFGGNWVLINDGTGNFTAGNTLDADIKTFCMGVSAGDMNRDGRLDLYITGTGDQHLLQKYDDGYVEITSAVGLENFEEDHMLWGADITDYNNDGYFDIFVATSELTNLTSTNTLLPIVLYEQNQDRQFEEVGHELGLEQETMSRVAIAHDINNDGIEDLIASSASRLAHVYLSDGCTENRWLHIKGPEGSIVQVVSGTNVWTHFITKNPGMAASKPRGAHIGLGDLEEVDFISLRQPWKEPVFLLGPIPTNQRIIYEPPP